VTDPSTRSRRARFALGAVLALVTVTAPRAARADDAKAEALFDEGRRKMQEPGKLDEACRTLEESYRLADRGDTLLNLAECHKRQGKVATAHAEFDKAIRIGAKFSFAEAIQVATEFRDELAKKISHLTVVVPPALAGAEDLTIEVGGAPWPKEKVGVAVAIDPGPVEVVATAKGYKKLTTRVEIGAEHDDKSVTIALEREPPPPPPPKPAPPPPAPKPAPSKPVWPWVVGAAGLGLAGAGVAFAFVQRGAGKELDDTCGADRQACPHGYDFDTVRSREVRSFGLFVGLGGAGLVALGAAGLGLGLASRSTTPAASLDVGPGSIAVHGSF
jgi:hypothetical protein